MSSRDHLIGVAYNLLCKIGLRNVRRVVLHVAYYREARTVVTTKRLLYAVGVLLLMVWLVWLSLATIRQSYFIRDHELRLVVQTGMTLPEATQAWGEPPRGIWTAKSAASVNYIPRRLRRFQTGRIVRYGSIWPSCCLWVHIDDEGFVDQTFFIRS